MARVESRSGDPGDPIIIKKYANRRLYNTAKSSYVTLDDLSRMVRAGEDFQVFDAKTGDDITRSVLTQIIFEEEAKGHNMLPTNFLRQLIRLYGDALQGLVPGYLEASMETFARNQERMREAFGKNQAFAGFEAMARSNMEWFEQAMKMFQPFAGPPGGAAAGSQAGAQGGAQSGGETTGATGATGPTPDLTQDIDRLQRQLREMQEKLDALSKERDEKT